MVSLRLIQSIEAHWEEIALNAARRVRQDVDVPHMAKLSDYELRDWVHTILNFCLRGPALV